MKLSALILAKGQSKRLEGKNKRDFKGKPMFLWNLEKCLNLFDDVYVSSDDPEILQMAQDYGARTIVRGQELCGDTPNIPVYQHAVGKMKKTDAIVAVQANSPTLDERLIAMVEDLLESGLNEVMTCHPNYSIYGSIWAMTKKRLANYKDPYKPTPEALLVDTSTDIHNQEDLEKALHE